MSVSLIQSNLRVTGSNIVYDPDFSGIGGTQVIQSGNRVLISGGGGSSGPAPSAPGGVTGVDGLTGNVLITGTGNFFAIVLNNQIVLSGNNNDALNLSGSLNTTGGYLFGLINAASAGVSSVNSASGALDIVGAGNVNVFTNGQIITISGNNNDAINLSGNLFNTGATLISRNLSTSGELSNRLVQTGLLNWLYTSAVSGNIIATGGLLLVTIASTGQQAWLAAQNNALNLSGALNASGRRAWDDATNLSGRLFLTGSILDTYIDALSGNLILTGQAAHNNVLNLSGALNASGRRAWDDAINLSGRIFSTGSVLNAYIDALSGNLTLTGQTAHNNALNLSGRLFATGAATIAHANSIGINLSGNLNASGRRAWDDAVNLSGNLALTGSNLFNLIINSSGLFAPTGTVISFLASVVTGWDTGYYTYDNHIFSTIPRVVATMELSGTNNMYGFIISGRSTSGFFVQYTDIIAESGIFLDVIAKS